MTGRREPAWPGLQPLDPPGGGLSELRRRIVRHERRRAARRAVLASAAAFVVLAGAALAVPRLGAPPPVPDALAGRLVAMRVGLVEPPDAPVSVRPDRRGDTAVRRVATGDERVAYYLVGGR